MARKKINLDSFGKVIKTEADILEKTSKRKGIIYTRVSSEKQKREGHGIEYQEGNCRAWAIGNEVDVVGVYKDEAVSGRFVDTRKDFLKAIAFLREQNKKGVKIHYFICDTTSRFSRNHDIKVTYDLVADVQQTGAELVAVGLGGIIDTKTEMGILQSGFSFLMDSIESKRGQTRVLNGMKGRLLNGYRPFAFPPVGYKQVEVKNGGKSNKILTTNEPDASTVREGLEMFAEGRLISKQDLFNFFKERQLTSNSIHNKTNKIHVSMIDRILDPWKLFIYAGYITYPDWDITEMIEAKHPALISLHTVEKILVKLGKYKSLANMKTTEYKSNVNEYPLRGILLCPKCDKNMTGRASKSHTGDLHYYYGCNNKKCEIYKKSLKRDLLHKEIKELIEGLTPDEGFMNLLEAIFKETWQNKKSYEDKLNLSKQKRLKDVASQLEQIMNKLLNTSNATLSAELEDRWAILNEEKNQIEEQMAYDPMAETEMVNLLNEMHTIFTNPLTLWDMGDHNMKKLLLKVLFNGKIYYIKDQGYRTPEVSLIYELFKQQKNTNPGVNAFGGP